MNLLYEDYKRTINPDEYHVDGTLEYVNFENDLIAKKKMLVRSKK